MRIHLVELFSIGLVLFSCTKEKVTPIDPACTSIISFSNDILPIIEANCVSCHDQGNASGGYNLSTYSKISANASAILGSMKGNGYQLMPQGGPALPDSIIMKFSCWIQQGKLDN